jgi:alcohol dehydrogenase (cytochrome c)
MRTLISNAARAGSLRRKGLLGATVVVLAVALVGIASAASRGHLSESAALKAAPAFTAKQEAAFSGANWINPGGDLANTRYSVLKQINTKNVKNLKVAWDKSYDGNLTDENEGNGVEYGGTFFIPTPNGNIVAADATTGSIKWTWNANVKAKGFVTSHRSLAIGGGRVYTENDAGTLIALNASTGTIEWQSQVALPGTSLESGAVPMYVNGKVIAGVSGAESGRGHLDAFNAKTGLLLWRTFTVLGSDDPTTGGGSVWTWTAVDPKLNLAYATTGNDADTKTAGDHKWTSSVLAFDLNTGAIKWGFQGVHHDLWDYDCPVPPVLFDTKINGKLRHGLEFVCKSDYHFELDRATGKPILPVKEKTTPAAAGGSDPNPVQVAALHASATQPIPQQKGEVVPHCATKAFVPGPTADGSAIHYSCTYALPGTGHYTASGINSLGGQTWQPMSYNPQLGYMNFCEIVSFAVQQAGKPIDITHLGLYQTSGWSGSVAAFNVKNNSLAWLHKFTAEKDGMCLSGSATTAGGLVFAGSNSGKHFYAFDAKTGKQLWSFTTDQYIAGPPIVYSVSGKEYVALYTGGQIPLLGGPAQRQDHMYVFSL